MKTDTRKKGMYFTWKHVFLSFVLILLMGTTVNAETSDWSSDGSQWYANGNVYYINNDTLYVSPSEPHSMGSGKKIATWKLNRFEYLGIAHAYKNKLYVVRGSDDEVNVTLYSVDIKTKKKTQIKNASNCYISAGAKNYIYGNKAKIYDSGAYPVYIWKISGNSLKEIKTLGKYIFGTNVVNNKVYYGAYPSTSQKKMTAYCCNLDGSNRKKLFTLQGTGQFCQVLISSVTEKTITVYVSGDKPGQYEYTIKTGKLKKVS